MDIKTQVLEIAAGAKKASRVLAGAPSPAKDASLLRMAEELVKNTEFLLDENGKDVRYAREKGLSSAMVDRLTLKAETVSGIARGLREVAALPDPVGKVTSLWKRPNGLVVGRMRIPLGVIGIIYESRPNVTADAAALCLKSGNTVILRGGSEAIHSNLAIAGILRRVLKENGLPEAAVQIIPTTDREAVHELLQLEEYIDLIIPRGGEDLIRAVVQTSRIPVIKHYKGVCHIYVDAGADLDMALDICMNAKVQRPGVCNAMETLLVHEKVAEAFLPTLLSEYREAGVSLRGCNRTIEIDPTVARATEEDWYAEYLDLILAVRVVSSLDEAIEHIRRYGSAHTDAIVTRSIQTAERFVREVDSSSVMVNVSTRFSDGGEYGLGAEIGISTDKLHARGPMGAADLTTTKWVVTGNGAIRQ